MSNVPIAKQIRVLDFGSWTVEVAEGQRVAACNPELLNALLAVAKAASDTSLARGRSENESAEIALGRALGDLNTQHPGWREWQP